MADPNAGRDFVEALEARRLFAAWFLQPVPPDGASDSPANYSYRATESGYLWMAEIGEIGEPKLYVQGMRFSADYDESAPSHAGDPGPDRQAYYQSLLRGVRAEYATTSPDGPEVEFYIEENDDGTFAVMAARDTAPTLSPVTERPVIESPANDEADLPVNDPSSPTRETSEQEPKTVPDRFAALRAVMNHRAPSVESRPSVFSVNEDPFTDDDVLGALITH